MVHTHDAYSPSLIWSFFIKKLPESGCGRFSLSLAAPSLMNHITVNLLDIHRAALQVYQLAILASSIVSVNHMEQKWKYWNEVLWYIKKHAQFDYQLPIGLFFGFHSDYYCNPKLPFRNLALFPSKSHSQCIVWNKCIFNLFHVANSSFVHILGFAAASKGLQQRR